MEDTQSFSTAPNSPERSDLQQDFMADLTLSEVIAALSYALDLTEGQPAGHSVRSCWIGMHIGKQLGLETKPLWNLYYTLLLKDAGCSSNAARIYELYGGDDRRLKQDFKLVNNDKLTQVIDFVIKHTGEGESFIKKSHRLLNLIVNGENLATEMFETRCERGADIAIRLGFNEDIAHGIRYLDEHWNGNGKPYKISGNDIPIASQIALMSQVADVFFQTSGKEGALIEIQSRKGTWFNPELVKVFQTLRQDFHFWHELSQADIYQKILRLEPSSHTIQLAESHLDDITEAFGMIVDSKSPYTFNHSHRVGLYTEKIAEKFGFTEPHRKHLKRGAILHDIGKLGVSNHILDKPGKLTEKERKEVEKHALYTEEILAHITPFSVLSKICGAHHERLDGKGYPYGRHADEIALETKIITVADIFDAITAERPYRAATPIEKTLEIMRSECGKAIDESVLDALEDVLPEITSTESLKAL